MSAYFSDILSRLWRRDSNRPKSGVAELEPSASTKAVISVCKKFFTQAGWELSPGGYGGDLRIDKDGASFHIIFLDVDVPFGPALLSNWSETRSMVPLPLVVVTRDEPVDAIRSVIIDAGICILRYTDVVRIAEIYTAAMATRGESLAVGNPQAPEAVQAGAPVDIDAIDDPEALIKLAYAAHDAREFTAATHLWERAREIVPTRIEGYVHGASALAALGEHKQAVHVLQEAEPVFPDRKHLIVKARAYAAETRMDWHAAFDIWEEARLEWPDDIECTDGSRRVARYLPSAEKADPPAGGSTKGDDFRV